MNIAGPTGSNVGLHRRANETRVYDATANVPNAVHRGVGRASGNSRMDPRIIDEPAVAVKTIRAVGTLGQIIARFVTSITMPNDSSAPTGSLGRRTNRSSATASSAQPNREWAR